ncbi:MAG: hypothetical protein GX304_05500 [Clostridiales bacterium]|jgi:hypothetical protein|nr:hypothetical protein [Clostridiales bacterium]
MKRIFFALSLALCLALACACGGEQDVIDSNISEIRIDIFEGRGDFFDVTIYVGKRESPYNFDGISEKLVDYCLINVMPAEELEEGYALNFTLTGGKFDESGTLTEDPSTGRFRTDIGKFYTGVTELNITLSCGEVVETVILHSKFDSNMIRWKDALAIAKENLVESFNAAYVEGVFHGEIYIRFINNPVMGEDKYYWFVMLRDRNGKVSTILIDSVSSAVVTKKIQ